MIQALLTAKAKPETKNNNGATPLELAAMYPAKDAAVARIQAWMTSHKKEPEVPVHSKAGLYAFVRSGYLLGYRC